MKGVPIPEGVDVKQVKERLANDGGYEVVHKSPGLELGVYTLVAPEPDRQQPHEVDEVDIVLDGRGTLEGERVELGEAKPRSCRRVPSTASSATRT